MNNYTKKNIKDPRSHEINNVGLQKAVEVYISYLFCPLLDKDSFNENMYIALSCPIK